MKRTRKALVLIGLGSVLALLLALPACLDPGGTMGETGTYYFDDRTGDHIFGSESVDTPVLVGATVSFEAGIECRKEWFGDYEDCTRASLTAIAIDPPGVFEQVGASRNAAPNPFTLRATGPGLAKITITDSRGVSDRIRLSAAEAVEARITSGMLSWFLANPESQLSPEPRYRLLPDAQMHVSADMLDDQGRELRGAGGTGWVAEPAGVVTIGYENTEHRGVTLSPGPQQGTATVRTAAPEGQISVASLGPLGEEELTFTLFTEGGEQAQPVPGPVTIAPDSDGHYPWALVLAAYDSEGRPVVGGGGHEASVEVTSGDAEALDLSCMGGPESTCEYFAGSGVFIAEVHGPGIVGVTLRRLGYEIPLAITIEPRPDEP